MPSRRHSNEIDPALLTSGVCPSVPWTFMKLRKSRRYPQMRGQKEFMETLAIVVLGDPGLPGKYAIQALHWHQPAPTCPWHASTMGGGTG